MGQIVMRIYTPKHIKLLIQRQAAMHGKNPIIAVLIIDLITKKVMSTG